MKFSPEIWDIQLITLVDRLNLHENLCIRQPKNCGVENFMTCDNRWGGLVQIYMQSLINASGNGMDNLLAKIVYDVDKLYVKI